jgi:hypothetical protein
VKDLTLLTVTDAAQFARDAAAQQRALAEATRQDIAAAVQIIRSARALRVAGADACQHMVARAGTL